MKVLLVAVNAKYIHSNLAVYDLKAYTENIPVEVELAEYTINQQQEEILRDIYEHKADVVAFSCYIWNITYVKALAEELHKIAPQVQIWFGGPEASYDAKQLLRELSYVELVIVGEGEETFAQLLQKHLLDGERLENIVGICYRENTGEICDNGIREYLTMDKIPFVYHDLDRFAHKILYYETSRGCPFRCSYCLSSIDKKVRFRSLSLVTRELQFFLDRKVPHVKFVDRTFNCKKSHSMAIWQYLLEHDNGITNFHFEISSDLLDDDELALMKQMRPGLIQLEIGVQATNLMVVKEIRRTMDLDKVARRVAQVNTFGNIHQHLDLIAGLPYEDIESFHRSFNDVYKMEPEQLQLGFLKVLKGSYMEEMKQKYGLLSQSKPPYEVLRTNWLSYEEVIRLKGVEEMVEVYYNSGQFEITMKVMEPLFESAFAMFQEFGAFYEEKGYFGMSHSRIRRAEILLEFMREQKSEDAVLQMLEESLTFDLYYRENCKSRPFWAPSPAEFKEQTRYYCKNGVKSHVEPFHYRFPEKSKKALNEIPTRLKQPVYMLFDYENRDPLDHQAHVTEVAAASMTEGQKMSERRSYVN